MKVIISKYLTVKVAFYACLAAFILNACIQEAYSIVSLECTFLALNGGIREEIYVNDTINADTLSLFLFLETAQIENSKNCKNVIIPDPIGTLMSFSSFAEWCHKETDVLITSNNDFNGTPAGSSLNHLFVTDNNLSIEAAIDDYFSQVIEDINPNMTSLIFHTTIKPSNPEQQFFIQLLTDKGNYQTETVAFYWY